MCSAPGIQNKECKAQIKDALDKIKGMQQVGVSLATGTVKIGCHEPAAELEIKSCIEHSGFKIESK